MTIDREEIERALVDAIGYTPAVEVRDGEVSISGMLRTEGEREAALDVIERLAPGLSVVEDLVVSSVIPEEVGGLDLAVGDLGGFTGAEPDTFDAEALEPGDFTDQRINRNTKTGDGPSGTASEDDDFSEGEEVIVPPTDPVRDRNNEFLGGFQTTAMDDNKEPETEVVGGRADEGIADALRLELRQDAATTALEIDVEVVNGVARLRGAVNDMDDAENAVAVVERFPGVVEVIDELEVRTI